MKPSALYKPDAIRAAYKLRYAWTGWPSTGHFPPEPSDASFDELRCNWQNDGIRMLIRQWEHRQVRFLTSLTPRVSPAVFAARMKGRLDHQLRQWGTSVKFRRNFGVRSIGHNRRAEVEEYIERQVAECEVDDIGIRNALRRFNSADRRVELSEPSQTSSGLYWYNLHFVFVTRRRRTICDQQRLRTIHDRCYRIASKKGHRISRLSVMPDHIHIALRGDVESAPEEIALGFLNNLAYAVGQRALWQRSYYVGTFGEYDMAAIRWCARG